MNNLGLTLFMSGKELDCEGGEKEKKKEKKQRTVFASYIVFSYV